MLLAVLRAEGKLPVDLPFWGLEDGGPLLIAPLGTAPVGTLVGDPNPHIPLHCHSRGFLWGSPPLQQVSLWALRLFHMSSEIQADGANCHSLMNSVCLQA